MRVALAGVSVLFALAMTAPAVVAQEAVSFDIVRFQVEGNSLLSSARVQELVAPYVGRRKVYGDIQKALEALENAYRSLGYGTVQVYVPEQELTTGVVRVQVTEVPIGKVVIAGNKHFDDDNIRASLPLLKEGTTPNLRLISESIQLANENPAKKVEVTFAASEEDENKVDAKLTVTDDDPTRTFVTVDNTGTKATGKHRIGFTYQNANLANRDQVLTMTYMTALDDPAGVDIDILSIGYRLPVYQLGDSLDFIYANSSTNTPATTPGALGLAVNGKGEVFAVRYNHMLPRLGEYSSKIVFGFDYKYINARCTIGGNPSALGTAGCTPYTVRPLSATYSGNWQRPGEAIDFNVGFTYNAFPMGSYFDYGPFANGDRGTDRYSQANGRQIKDEFAALRFGGSYVKALPADMMVRAAVSAQYVQNPMLSGEQIGLAGSTTVRGFLERAVSTDRGYVANLELYSPDYAGKLGVKGSLKAVAFYDWASGQNLKTASFSRANIASAGIGFRYSLNKDISAKFDLARVLEGHQPTPGNSAEAAKPGDIRGHFSFAYGF